MSANQRNTDAPQSSANKRNKRRKKVHDAIRAGQWCFGDKEPRIAVATSSGAEGENICLATPWECSEQEMTKRSSCWSGW